MPGIGETGIGENGHHQSHLWEVTGRAQESVSEKGGMDGVMRRTL